MVLSSRTPIPDTPGPTPAPTVAPSSASGPNLTATFTSPIYGYTIKTDPRWTVTPATAFAGDPATGDNGADYLAITGTDTTIAIRAEALGSQRFGDWLAVQHQAALDNTTVPDSCKASTPNDWPSTPVGDSAGRIMTLCNFAVVFAQAGEQAFSFEWAHSTFSAGEHLPFADFQQLLTTITFAPTSPGSVDHLSNTFSSPLYGYSIQLDPSWAITPATVPLNDPLSTDATVADSFHVSGTDTTASGSWRSASATGRSASDLAYQHGEVLKQALPDNCKGGDPSTWGSLPVGVHQGRVMVMCNFEVVFVQSGERVYQFAWGHRSFDEAEHLQLPDFERVLQTVRFSTSILASPAASPAP